MPSLNEFDDESVDALLNSSSYGCDGALRDAVLARTTGVLRRRRRARRAVLVSALGIFYFAGVLTTHLWRLSDRNSVGPIAKQDLPQKDQPRDTVSRAQPDRVAVSHPPKAQGPPRQSKKLRQAGFEDIRRVSDRFLQDRGDVALALQYYSRALDAASDEQRAISIEKDSWLLMALKASQMKESKHDDNI